MSKKVSIAEGFDFLVNQLRYMKYYLLALIIVPITSFLLSLIYFILSQPILKQSLVISIKYILLSFKYWLLGNLLKFKKTVYYDYYQDIYNTFFHYMLHSREFYYSLAISFIITALTFYLTMIYTRKLYEEKVIRGTKVKNIGKVSNIKKDLKFAPKEEVKHALVVGTTGSGKTQVIKNLMRFFICTGKNIIFDIKGDFVARFYRKGIDHIINPLDIRSSRWNFLEEAQDTADIAVLSESFISQENSGSNSDKDKYFTGNARYISSTILEYLYSQGITDNAEIRNIIINEVFYKTNNKLLADILQKLNVGSNVSFADTLSTLRLHLNFIRIVGHEPKSNPIFSISEWLNSDEQSNVFITSIPDKSAITKGFNTAFLNMFFLKILSLPDVTKNQIRVRIWIDELANLARIPELAKTLTFSRSKGCAIYLSTQSLEGLKRNYSTYEIMDIVNSCNNLICFRAVDEFTASTISKFIGQRQVEVPQKNRFSTPDVSRIDGITLSTARATEYAVLPSEIMALPDLEFYAKTRSKWYKGKLKPITIPPKEDVEFFIKNRAINLKKPTESSNGDINNEGASNNKDKQPKNSGGFSISDEEKKISKSKVESKFKVNTKDESLVSDFASTSKSKPESKSISKSQDNPLNLANKFME